MASTAAYVLEEDFFILLNLLPSRAQKCAAPAAMPVTSQSQGAETNRLAGCRPLFRRYHEA